MNQTTAATARSDFSISFVSEVAPRKESTSQESTKQRTADYLATGSPSKNTESALRTEVAAVNLVPKEVSDPAQAQLPLQKQAIEGSILGIDGTSVSCEVYLERGAVKLSIPRTFFPADASYGAPISIAIDESSGVRRPIVTLLELDHNVVSKHDAEVAKLVASLKR